MGYTIPQNWNDEAMEYVNKLTDKINVGWDGEDYCLSDWNLRFLSRMNREVIKPPFTYQAFLDNKDIIATLEGYELDVEKFWFALLYIYDITCDFGINAADASKTDYDILVEIEDYLENHPQAVLYLSDDKELRKSERYETNSPVILQNLRRFVKRELDKYQEAPQLKVWTHDIMCRNYTESLGAAQQQVLMYKLFKVLFDLLGMPDLRAERGSTVSYSKLLLISRIIHFCRLSRKEVFLVSDSALKGNIKQYGDFDFNQRHPKTYAGGLKLPKEEGE